MSKTRVPLAKRCFLESPFDYANAVFTSAVGSRAMRSWVVRVEQLPDCLDIASREILLRS